MNTINSKSSFRNKLLPVFLLAAAMGVQNLLYVISVFYVPYQEAFGYTNLQMGLLMSIYSWIGTPGSLLAGPLTDQWNPKKTMCICCFVGVGCGLVLATIPPFPVACAVYAIMPLSITWFGWTLYNKCITIIATDGDSGRLFGLGSTFDCILTLCITMFPTLLFGDALGKPQNFRLVFIIMSAVYLVSGILLYIFFDYDYYAQKAGIVKEKKEHKVFSLKEYFSDYAKVIKTPVPWLAGLLVMGMYTTATSFNYLSKYLNDIFAISVGLASAYGIIVRYFVKAIVNPLGGTFRDKKLGGSTPKLVWLASIMVFIVGGALFLIPKNPANGLLATIVAILVVCVFRFNSSSEATAFTIVDTFPLGLMGSAMGLGFTIAYSTDMWLPIVIGNILDTKGPEGYNFIFVIMFAGMILASACAYLLNKYAKAERAKLAQEK